MTNERPTLKPEKINLNHEYFELPKYRYGRTQLIEIKLGKKRYFVDIDKGAVYTVIDMYDFGAKSKYGSNRHSVYVNSEVCLNRKFFESFEEIEKAQEIYKRFDRELKY